MEKTRKHQFRLSIHDWANDKNSPIARLGLTEKPQNQLWISVDQNIILIPNVTKTTRSGPIDLQSNGNRRTKMACSK